ncbi:MAG: hypothetical protein IJ086_16065 [Clostridium sp.]|nr:hypothetical protein [Clostridium sp.]
MSYLAVKNGEYKGVYKNTKENRKALCSNGVSSRVFEDSQKKEALKWAGVSNVTPASQVKLSTNKPKGDSCSEEEKVVVANPVIDIANHYIKEGYDGISIFLKNETCVIIKLRDLYLFKSSYDSFERNEESRGYIYLYNINKIKEQIKEGIEYLTADYWSRKSRPALLDYKNEVAIIRNNSKISCLNKEYIHIKNFYIVEKGGNTYRELLKDSRIPVSRIVSINGNRNDLLDLDKQSDLFLNTNEISFIKPLTLGEPKDLYQIFSDYRSNYNKCVRITSKQFNELNNSIKEANAQCDKFELLTINNIE